MRSLLGRLRRPISRSEVSRALTRVSLGDGRTLDLDFTQGVLDSRITFTRASTTATVINSSGLVTSAGTDVPRFDHDPSTLAPRGLLIESQATNLVTYSDCRTTGWAGINATGTNDNATAPNNTTTATLWTGGSGGITRAYSATFSVTTGTTYTVSAYVKKPSTNGAQYAKIDMRNAFEGDVGWPLTGNIDLNTGVASGTGFTATAMQNGWYRIIYTGTVNATTNARAFLRITDATGSINITSTNALLWWGAQVETGSTASSHIPTAASQATRAVDEATMTGTNFSSWFNATTGTLAAYGQRRLTSDFGRLASINDNTANESLDLGGSTTGKWVIRDGGSDVADITPGTVTANTDFKIAGTYAVNDAQAAFGGTLGTADTSLTLPTVDRMMIGRQAGTSVYLNGTISRLIYWPLRLPNATLQSLTQ